MEEEGRGERRRKTMMTNASASVGIGIEREGGGAVREGGGAVREGGGAVSFGLAFAGRRRRALKRTYPIRRSYIRRSLSASFGAPNRSLLAPTPR